MNYREAGEFLAYISALDGRNFNEYTAAVWHEVIGEYTLTECKTAAKEHFTEKSDWLMPSHVQSIIKTERRNRLARVETIVPSRADMTSTAAELATTKALSKAIASGELTPEAYEDYMRGNTPWVTYRRGLRELRAA